MNRTAGPLPLSRYHRSCPCSVAVRTAARQRNPTVTDPAGPGGQARSRAAARPGPAARSAAARPPARTAAQRAPVQPGRARPGPSRRPGRGAAGSTRRRAPAGPSRAGHRLPRPDRQVGGASVTRWCTTVRRGRLRTPISAPAPLYVDEPVGAAAGGPAEPRSCRPRPSWPMPATHGTPGAGVAPHQPHPPAGQPGARRVAQRPGDADPAPPPGRRRPGHARALPGQDPGHRRARCPSGLTATSRTV